MQPMEDTKRVNEPLQSNVSFKGIQPLQARTVRTKLWELSSCYSFRAAGGKDVP